MRTRAIKQIAIAQTETTFSQNKSIVALCEDNSVWLLQGSMNAWHRLPDIPKDISETEKENTVRKTLGYGVYI